VEITNITNGVFTDEDIAYLKSEKRNAPRGSRLPNAIPVWVRRKLLLNAEMRAAQTLPVKRAVHPPTVSDSDQRERMARQLAVASL
jgi:hypothetical protein